MLVMDKPKIEIHGKDAVISANYTLRNNRDHLWFSIPKRYEEFLVAENADAFVVGLLLLAMKNGRSIQVNAPMSRRLYYQLTHYLIPALDLAIPELKPIEIVAAGGLTSNDLNEAGVAGTGMSCGVDSFCTFVDHLDCEHEFEIKYFTFFNEGSSHVSLDRDSSRKLFLDRIALVESFAEEVEIPIIAMDSNIHEILPMEYGRTHTIRTVAFALNLQKLFRNYYYSSAYRFDHFRLNPHDTADYDLLLLSTLSTESTTFHSSASQYTRVQRTKMVSGYAPSYSHLNVCFARARTSELDGKNCSVCTKCLRTQLTLDLLGRLYLYDDVFDHAKYTRNKNRFIAYCLYHKRRDPLSREIIDLMKATRTKIPLSSRLYYLILVAICTLPLPEGITKQLLSIGRR